jgi:hypothetical protein
MATEKQIEANRRNAQLSTGPRTPEGKAKSALNGFKSPYIGLTAIMTDDDRIAQRDFVDAYIQDLDPLGPVERQLANTLALDNWRLNRIKAAEENIFAWGYAVDPGEEAGTEIPQVNAAFAHALSYLTHADAINKLSLYESRLNRNIARNTKLLNERQTQRPQRRAQPASPEQNQQFSQAGRAMHARSGLIPTETGSQTNSTGHGFVQPLYKTAQAPAPEVAENTTKTPKRSGLIPTTAESETKNTGQAA